MVVLLVVCSDDAGAVGAAASASVAASAADSTAAACTASRGLRRGWMDDRVVTGMVLCDPVDWLKEAVDFFGGFYVGVVLLFVCVVCVLLLLARGKILFVSPGVLSLTTFFPFFGGHVIS